MRGEVLHTPASSGLALRTGTHPGAPHWEGASGVQMGPQAQPSGKFPPLGEARGGVRDLGSKVMGDPPHSRTPPPGRRDSERHFPGKELYCPSPGRKRPA